MEQKMLEKIKKTAINSAFVVGTTETKEKKYNVYNEKENDFYVLGEKLAKDIFVEQILAETNYNKNELKEFILENKDVFKTGDKELEKLSYKDMVKFVKNSSNEIIDFKNDVEPLFERAFAYSEENTINECKQDYFESLGRKKLLPMLLKKVEENVEHFKDVKDFKIDDVDNEFGREDDYYQFRDKLMKDVSNEFYDTFVTKVYNLDYKTDREDKKEEKEKLMEFFEVNPLLADDFFKFISSNKIDENLFDELYDKLENVMDKTVNQEDGKQIEFVSPYEIDKNGKLSFDMFDMNEKNFDEKDSDFTNEKENDLTNAKKEVNQKIAEKFAKNFGKSFSQFKRSVYSSLDNDFTLDLFSIVEKENRETKEKKVEILENYKVKDEVNIRLKGYVPSGIGTRDITEEEKNTDIKVHSLKAEDKDTIKKEILNILKKTKNEKDIEKEIFNYLEKNDFYKDSFEINEKKLEKADKFFNALANLTKNINIDLNTTYNVSITQKDGKQYYNLSFQNNKTKDKKEINSNSLDDFKDKIVDFLDKNINEKEEKYFKDTNKDHNLLLLIRKKDLKKLKNIDFSNLETELDKNFKFEFSNKEVGDCTHHLTIENDRNFKKGDVYSLEAIRKMSYILTNKDFSENIVDNNIFVSEEKKKIDFLKEENKNIMEKINENIEKETFSEAKADIVMMSVLEVGKKQTKNEVSYSHHIGESIETYFNNRIGNLKDKESFVEKNADELGLTLNENGKIVELYNGNEDEYKDNINQFLNAVKQNIKEEIIEKFEMTDMLQDDFHKNDKVKEVNHTKEMSGYILERKKDAIEEIKDEYYDKMPETLTLQNKFLKNAIPIILSEKKVDLSSKELDNLLVISDEKKFLIDRNVNSYFNSLSKNSENIYDEFNTKRNYESFSKSEFDKFTKTEIKEPKIKKEVPEKEKVNTDKEIEF